MANNADIRSQIITFQDMGGRLRALRRALPADADALNIMAEIAEDYAVIGNFLANKYPAFYDTAGGDKKLKRWIDAEIAAGHMIGWDRETVLAGGGQKYNGRAVIYDADVDWLTELNMAVLKRYGRRVRKIYGMTADAKCGPAVPKYDSAGAGFSTILELDGNIFSMWGMAFDGGDAADASANGLNISARQGAQNADLLRRWLGPARAR